MAVYEFGLMKRFWLITLLFWTVAGTPASASSYRFNRLTVEDGITQSEVYCFLKSRSGHIWIGTLCGLNRFDGYTVTQFNTDIYDPYSLRGSTVLSLAEDPGQRIWIGTNSGLNVYDPETDRFHFIRLPGASYPTSVRSILSHDDTMWIGTTDGLYAAPADLKLSAPASSGIRRIDLPYRPDITSVGVHSINSDRQGGIWICCDYDLFLYNGSSAKNMFCLPFGNHYFYRSRIDDFGNVWIGCKGRGLIRYSPESNKVRYFEPDGPGTLSSGNISDLEIDAKGTLWIATVDKGLNRLPRESLNDDHPKFDQIREDPNAPKGIGSDLLYSLYCKDNILWVGTIGSGVNYMDFSQKPFRYWGIPEKRFVRSVYADEEFLWIGTHNNGLYRIDRRTGQRRKIGFGNTAIFHIMSEGDSRLWLCTDNGVLYIDKRSPEEAHALLQHISSFYICSSKPGVYWVATILGLRRVEWRDGRLISDDNLSTGSAPAISLPNCRVVQYNPECNELWLGMEGGGVNRIQLDQDHRPVHVDSFQHDESGRASLTNNFVRDICIQDRDNVWIGTYDGLNRIRRKAGGAFEVTNVTVRDGLANNTIEGIWKDNFETLWVATNKGLSRIESADGAIVNFDVNDGLQGREFSEHARCASPDGELFFGGTQGVTGFFPNQIRLTAQTYEVRITDFYLYNRKINPGDTLRGGRIFRKPVYMCDSLSLHSKENNLRFDFSAMSCVAQDKIRYAYRLEGYDNEWFYTDSRQRFATYTNLNFGKYLFEVKAMNEAGVWSEPRRLFIRIRTPLLLRWYFILFYTLVFAGGIYGLLASIENKRKRLLEKRHKDKLYELERSRMQFFINVSHDLQTPLTLIVGPLDQLLTTNRFSGEVPRILRLIERNAKRLQTMVEQILEIRKAETGYLQVKNSDVDLCALVARVVEHFRFAFQEKNLKLELKCDPEMFFMITDQDMVDKILFNLLSNSLKYTQVGGVEITVSRKGEQAFVRVADSGQGIADNELSHIFDKFYNNPHSSVKGFGIGLAHCRELVSLLGGRIEVVSQVGIGSIFTVVLPVVEPEAKALPVDSPATRPDTEPCGDAPSLGTILVAEDDDDMRDYIRSVFEGKYNVLEAGNGEDGLAMVSQFNVDAVVSDVMMPRMNGVEMCKAIKSNPKTAGVPVILLTALKGENTRYKGLETGANDYITKPFDNKELFLKVKNLIDSRRGVISGFESRFMLDISTSVTTSEDEKFLRKVVEVIEKQYTDPDFSIEVLERELSMSHASFYRKLKQLTGMSAKLILQEYRFKKAESLLVTTDLRVSEIAEAVGFNNLFHFSNMFKEKYGDAPLQYRKRMQK